MASYQDSSPFELFNGHKREQSQDSGAYIDWNSEDSASPVGNPENGIQEEFVTVVSVDNYGLDEKKDETPFVTILAIGEGNDNSNKIQQNHLEEEVSVYRLPGERLGFGLKFEGGMNTAENVKRLFIQSSAPDSPASRANCSWGSLVAGDEILKIDGHVVKDMTRLDCVRCLKESSVVIKLFVRHKSKKTGSQNSRTKLENQIETRSCSVSFTSPTVVSAEMKKKLPPPPPVPPRKISKKNSLASSLKEDVTFPLFDGIDDSQNALSPIPKARNIHAVSDETNKTLSKYIIKVAQKDSLDSCKNVLKRNASDFKLLPPEPKIHLDLFAQEENRNCESESDDTGSTVSTVIGMPSNPNTTNSSFSDLKSSASSFCDSTNPSTPTSEPSTPVFDLTKILSPYDNTDRSDFLLSKLINGKDQDSIYDEKSSMCSDELLPLQPPLSFQDAPLSYGNEEMRVGLTNPLNVFSDEHLINGFQYNENDTVNESDMSIDNKCKDKPTNISKKPSLIPRLAKSIGLLSPPKPNPRKETKTDGSKSRFNKKKSPPPPPLPSPVDNAPNLNLDTLESKILKSSIPYLKKKKNKLEDSKKKTEVKVEKKITVSEDIIKEKPATNESDEQSEIVITEKAVQESIRLAEDKDLTWKVPVLKDFKETVSEGEPGLLNQIYGEDFKISSSDTKEFLSDFEKEGFDSKTPETCEVHFMLSWSAPKPLETIGEVEEDVGVDERYSSLRVSY